MVDVTSQLLVEVPFHRKTLDAHQAVDVVRMLSD